MRKKNAMGTLNKTFLPVLLFIFLPVVLTAQDPDFGIWTSVKARHDFNKQLEAELSFELRTAENVSVTDQYFGELGLSYSFNDYFAAGASFRSIGKLEDDEEYHFRQKFLFHLKGTIPLGRLDVSARVMYEKVLLSYVEDFDDPMSENYARTRFKAEYDSKSSPLKPFISWEPFFPLSGDPDYTIEKSRLSAGTELKISRRSSFGISYIFDNKTKPTRTDEHIISVGYELKF